jgi:hypothetical protein
LLSEFEASSWTVTDRQGKRTDIDFDWPLPDGTRFTGNLNRHLLQTVELYALEIRMGPFAFTEDALQQRFFADALMYIVYWMRRQNIRSFADLTDRDTGQFAQDARFGAEGLTDAAPRLRDYCELAVKAGATLPTRRLGGRSNLLELHTTRLLDQAGRPCAVATDPRVTWVVAQVSRG